MDAGPTGAAPPPILHGRGMAMWRGPLPYRKRLSCRVQTLSRVHTTKSLFIVCTRQRAVCCQRNI